MKKLLPILTAILLGACSSPKNGTYSFSDLVFTFPSGYEAAEIEENPSQGTASLFIREIDNRSNRIELSLSKMDPALLADIPMEEVFGEMVADVAELYQAVSSFEDISITEEPKVESDGSNKLPAELFCQFTAEVSDGSVLHLRISSKIIPPYNIRSLTWAESSEKLEEMTDILKRAKTGSSD